MNYQVEEASKLIMIIGRNRHQHTHEEIDSAEAQLLCSATTGGISLEKSVKGLGFILMVIGFFFMADAVKEVSGTGSLLHHRSTDPAWFRLIQPWLLLVQWSFFGLLMIGGLGLTLLRDWGRQLLATCARVGSVVLTTYGILAFTAILFMPLLAAHTDGVGTGLVVAVMAVVFLAVLTRTLTCIAALFDALLRGLHSDVVKAMCNEKRSSS